MRPLRRLAACRDNEASGEGVSALSAGAIAWLKSLRPKHGVEQGAYGNFTPCNLHSYSNIVVM